MTFVSKFKVKLLKNLHFKPQSGIYHKWVYDSPRFYARQTNYKFPVGGNKEALKVFSYFLIKYYINLSGPI